MVGVSASVNFHLHRKVQKFSSGTGSPGWSRKKGRKTVVVWCGVVIPSNISEGRLLRGGNACDFCRLVTELLICACSPIATHYFPSLYHDKYELEDGYTAAGGAVRYGFDSREFDDYSWRGYAVYSRLQVSHSRLFPHLTPGKCFICHESIRIEILLLNSRFYACFKTYVGIYP